MWAAPGWGCGAFVMDVVPRLDTAGLDTRRSSARPPSRHRGELMYSCDDLKLYTGYDGEQETASSQKHNSRNQWR